MTANDSPDLEINSSSDPSQEKQPQQEQEASPVLERWNHPRSNIFKTLATFWCFLVMGANDAAYGPLIPYLEIYYNLTYTTISLVFLSPLGGYIAAALLNNRIHLRFGQRGIAFIAPLCHLIAYIVNCVHPPYPVLVVSFILAGFGTGLCDSAWNAFVGNMQSANQVLGFLHAFYGVGAVLSPLIATTMITKAGLEWYCFYYIMIGCALLELIISLSVFWTSTASKYHGNVTTDSNQDQDQGGLRKALFHRRHGRVTWLCAFFLLGYVGIEVSLGGWIVTFMMRVRDASAFASGMTATGFWLGLTVGRVVLGFVTERIGERIAISVYLLASIAFNFILWFVPNFYASAVAVSMEGFFLGPLFPGAIVMATKLLPRSLHVSAIGFAAAIGSGGAALLPFAVGAIAQATKGVGVLQPFGIGLLAGITVLWLLLPSIKKGSR